VTDHYVNNQVKKLNRQLTVLVKKIERLESRFVRFTDKVNRQVQSLLEDNLPLEDQPIYNEEE